MKQHKILLTLFSVAAIGLSSVAVQAQDTDTKRPRHQRGQLLDRIELSEDLQALVDNFREERAALMKQFRVLRMEHRETIAPFLSDLRSIDKEADPEAWKAARAEVRKAHEAFREEYGEDIRAARHDMKVLRRQFRYQFRDQIRD